MVFVQVKFNYYNMLFNRLFIRRSRTAQTLRHRSGEDDASRPSGVHCDTSKREDKKYEMKS